MTQRCVVIGLGFVLRGGDSPWRKDHCGPVGILAAVCWCGTVIVRSISRGRKIVGVRNPVHGAGCTEPLHGRNSERPNCCGNHSAGSVPGKDAGPVPRTQITSGTTRETGRSSRTLGICKVSATAATAGKRYGTGRKINAADHMTRTSFGRGGVVQVRARGSLRTFPPARKSFRMAA